MSRRAKFAFITWIGPGVSPLKKAKVSTDKAFVKQVFVVSVFRFNDLLCDNYVAHFNYLVVCACGNSCDQI